MTQRLMNRIDKPHSRIERPQPNACPQHCQSRYREWFQNGSRFGDRYIPPAAEALEAKFPEAASLLYRRLVESVLERASSKQYPYAARDLLSCVRLAPNLPAPGSIESHAAFVARLQKVHGRKYGFWGLIEQKGF